MASNLRIECKRDIILIVSVDPTMGHPVAMHELAQPKRRGVCTVTEDM